MLSLFQDVPLFNGIVSDLFPGVKLPEPDYDNLTDSLVHSIETMDLQPVDWFITKIIQVLINVMLPNIAHVTY